MKEMLKALRGARVIAQGWGEDGRKITHYLLSDGRVIETIQ